jgi:secreted trypsin-like serine protease
MLTIDKNINFSFHSRLSLAAHCVSRKRFSKRSLEPSELKVILGEHDLSKKELRTEEVKTIIVHSDWDQNKISFDGDIALIVLKKPVKFNKDLRPVCLPKEDLKSNNLKGTLVGWGLKNDNELSSIARKIILPIMNVGDCIIAERRLSHLYWKESFCAGRKGVGACAGDSGSGFYVEKDGIYYLVGIVSSAVSTMCTESNVALYSDIYSYYRFITQLMKPEFDVIPSYLSKYLHLDLYDEFGAYGMIHSLILLLF